MLWSFLAFTFNLHSVYYSIPMYSNPNKQALRVLRMAFLSIPPSTLSSLVCINQRRPLYWLNTEERSSSASVQRKKLGKKKPFCWLTRESTSYGKDEKKRTKKKKEKKKRGFFFSSQTWELKPVKNTGGQQPDLTKSTAKVHLQFLDPSKFGLLIRFHILTPDNKIQLTVVVHTIALETYDTRIRNLTYVTCTDTVRYGYGHGIWVECGTHFQDTGFVRNWMKQ